MSTTPIVIGDRILDPALQPYAPREVSPHCEALKDLLLFMRNQGIRAEHIAVGADGVTLNNVTDDYPRKQPPAPAKPDDEMKLYEDE